MDLSPENIFLYIKSLPNQEVEFKYKFSKEDIITFLVNYKDVFAKKCEHQFTTNLIYTDKSKNKNDYIITKDHKTDKYSYMFKKKNLSLDFNNSVRLNISSENPSTAANKPSINTAFLVRIKNRLSIPHEHGRFDVTQVVHINGDSPTKINSIKAMQENLQFGMKGYTKPEDVYNAFLANMTNQVITSVELEYEFTDLKAEFLTLDYALSLLGEAYSASVIKSTILTDIAQDIGAKGNTLKSILNNATCLTAPMYNRIYPPLEWYITPKADGYTGLAVINKTGRNYFIHNNETVEVQYTADKYTVLVGEVVDKTFYCFDALIINDENLLLVPFSKRYELFRLYLSESIKFGEYTLVAKDHIRITDDLQRSFKSVIELPKPYEIDGYVLVSPNNSYVETQNYKIKEQNTIDFLIIECPPDLAKEEIYKSTKTGATFLLFCTINEYDLRKASIKRLKGYNTLFPGLSRGALPIQFCPADNPLAYIWFTDAETTKKLRSVGSRIIAELLYNGVDWDIIKIREDRVNEPNYYGNGLLKVAEPSWFATKYPFTIQDMANPLTNYFGLGKDVMYKAQTGFNSYVKNRLLTSASTMIPSRTAIDLAAGKGQDIGRYCDQRFNKVVFCDIDPIALCELTTRRYEIVRDQRKKCEMAVQVLCRDLTLPADDTISILQPLIDQTNIGLIVCNFAIHYMITDIEKLNNFIRLIKGIASDKTIFYFTTMSGQSVVDLIGYADEWKAHENNVLKYNIVKKYEGRELADMGQTIATKLPFSDTLYEENLVNLKLVNNQFVKFGFKLIASESFSVYFNQFKEDNKPVFNLLTPDDKKYLSLYHYSMFEC